MDSVLKISFLLFVSLFFVGFIKAQSFPPQVGFNGSTAIHKDDTLFKDWAINAEIIRGYRNIANPTNGFVSFGEAVNATGIANGSQGIVSLGDNGEAILTFNHSIVNGNGFDFAVFENGFLENETSELAFLELAFVEVSTDGIEYVRFPSVSELETTIQIPSFDYINARYIHNFAGKYIANYGTPFDLEDLTELINGTTVNLNQINFVKIIDVIGTINEQYATVDSQMNFVNDPYPSEFISGGFDLDAIGVINNEVVVSIEDITIDNTIKIFPNPVKNNLNLLFEEIIESVKVQSLNGKELISVQNKTIINVSKLQKGLYVVLIKTKTNVYLKKVFIN